MLLERFSCRPLLALFAVPLFVACGYGDHPPNQDHPYEGWGGYTSDPTPPRAIEEAAIDADELLDVDPGVGAGAFVEYESGGTYHVTTSCDVGQGADCYWDIVVTPLDDAAVSSLSPVDLESDDSVVLGSGNQLRMVAYTGSDFDGFNFQTDPGAAVELDVLLDDAAGNRYLFWVGDGALRSGAPSNPVRLVPSAD
jgi:hypothetical protein